MIILGDIHFGIRNSNKFFAEVQQNFFKKTFFPYVLANKVKDVICLGDLLDSRTSISFTTLKILYEFLEWFEKNEVKFHSILGNHDQTFKESNKLSGIRELSQMFPNFHLIDKPEKMILKSQKFLMLPWICSENRDEVLEFLEQNDDPDSIVCGHLELAGFKMTENYLSEKSSIPIELLRNKKTVFSGHYHLSSQNGNIIYVGTPYQLTWNDADDKKRFFHHKNEFQEIEIKERIYHKIFYQKGISSQNDYRNLKGFAKIYVSEEELDLDYEKFLESFQKNNEFQNISSITVTNSPKENNIEIKNIDDPISILLKSIDSNETPKNLSKKDVKNSILEILEEVKREEK
jgi:DNA repair exonuclease SbcCD nuclease subunit